MMGHQLQSIHLCLQTQAQSLEETPFSTRVLNEKKDPITYMLQYTHQLQPSKSTASSQAPCTRRLPTPPYYAKHSIYRKESGKGEKRKPRKWEEAEDAHIRQGGSTT